MKIRLLAKKVGRSKNDKLSHVTKLLDDNNVENILLLVYLRSYGLLIRLLISCPGTGIRLVYAGFFVYITYLRLCNELAARSLIGRNARKSNVGFLCNDRYYFCTVSVLENVGATVRIFCPLFSLMMKF